jgi:hypothetical protein
MGHLALILFCLKVMINVVIDLMDTLTPVTNLWIEERYTSKNPFISRVC